MVSHFKISEGNYLWELYIIRGERGFFSSYFIKEQSTREFPISCTADLESPARDIHVQLPVTAGTVDRFGLSSSSSAFSFCSKKVRNA